MSAGSWMRDAATVQDILDELRESQLGYVSDHKREALIACQEAAVTLVIALEELVKVARRE